MPLRPHPKNGVVSLACVPCSFSYGRWLRGTNSICHTWWSSGTTRYPRDVIELALAHAIRDKSEAAYRRGSALEKRRRLMTEWARYCYSPAMAGEVVALHG